MKKIKLVFLSLSLSLSLCFAEEFKFITINDLYVQCSTELSIVQKIPKNSNLYLNSENTSIYVNDNQLYFDAFYFDKEYYFNDNDIEFENSNLGIPKQIQNCYWILDYYFDMLHKKDISVLSKNEPYYEIENEYTYSDRDELIPWYSYFDVLYFKIGKYIMLSSNPTKYGGPIEFITLPTSYNDKILELEIPTLNYRRFSKPAKIWQKLTNIQCPYKLVLSIDGDYLYIYKHEINEENLLYRLIRGNQNTYDEIYNFVKTGAYDKSKIIWPHHADGTSEYEDTIRYPEPVIIEEPEEIKIEEYQEENKEKESEKPPIPDENDPNFLEILRVYYPEYYSSWAQVFKYRRRMQILKISIISAVSLTVIIIAIIIIIKKKKKSAK